MAPEGLHEGKFSSQSDVGSFGVVLWEIWSYACLPYSALTNQEVVEAAANGNLRLEQPTGCPDALYRIMKEVIENCAPTCIGQCSLVSSVGKNCLRYGPASELCKRN